MKMFKVYYNNQNFGKYFVEVKAKNLKDAIKYAEMNCCKLETIEEVKEFEN